MGAGLPRAWVAVLVAGCAASGHGSSTTTSEAREAAASERPDPAAELARQLPQGATTCAVTRPERVGAARRPLLELVSRADPLGWLPEPAVQAYAWAERSTRSGHRPMVVLLRLKDGQARVHQRLEREAPVRLAWDGNGCRDGRCHALRARFVAPDTLRLERGEWSARTSHKGVETHCAELARTRRDAVEVAVRRGESPVPSLQDLVPRRVEHIVTTSSRGVTVSRTQHMATPEAARDAARNVWSVDFRGGSDRPLPAGVETERQGRQVRAHLRYRWADLQLARGDETRIRHAVARQSSERLIAVDEVNVSDLTQLRPQVRWRRQRLQGLHGAERRHAARELRDLLERAVRAHPRRTELARRLVRLLLDELEDGQGAARWAARVLDEGHPSNPARWRLLRREAKALVGREALAETLVEDDLVGSADASRAARDLVALRGRGVDYEWAEGAWLGANRLTRRAAAMHLREVPEASLPLVSVVDAIVTLARIGPLDGAKPHAVYVLVRGPDEKPPELEAGRGAFLPVHGSDGERVWLAASTADEAGGHRSVGASLRRFGGTDSARLVVAFVPLAAKSREAVLTVQLAGAIRRDAFLVQRAAPRDAARVSWARVARYLARPLSSLEGRVFPPPDLELVARDGDKARDLARRAARIAPESDCRVEGHRLRCTAPPHEPSAARRILDRFARELLATDARRLEVD